MDVSDRDLLKGHTEALEHCQKYIRHDLQGTRVERQKKAKVVWFSQVQYTIPTEYLEKINREHRFSVFE